MDCSVFLFSHMLVKNVSIAKSWFLFIRYTILTFRVEKLFKLYFIALVDAKWQIVEFSYEFNYTRIIFDILKMIDKTCIFIWAFLTAIRN